MKKIDNIAITNILILLISIFCSYNTFASYKSVYESESSIEIAKPIFNLVTSSIADKINPTNEIETNFSITNFNGNEINDITLKYYLVISLENDKLPLEYKLYKKENDTLTELPLTNNQTDYFTLNKDVKETQDFVLKISWNELETSYEYQNITDYIKINAYIEQL